MGIAKKRSEARWHHAAVRKETSYKGARRGQSRTLPNREILNEMGLGGIDAQGEKRLKVRGDISFDEGEDERKNLS